MVITSNTIELESPLKLVRRSRAHVLYAAMVSGYDNVHIRANLYRLQMAMQYGHSAGDR